MPSSYTAVARRHKTYRGGFRSSICDLFSDPSRKADCCALACCGVLQSDKNRYLLNGERPVWWKRIAFNVIVPMMALFVGSTIAAILVVGASGGNKEIDNDSSLPGLWFLLIFVVVVVVLCIRGRLIRMRLRIEIMNRMYQEHGANGERPHDNDIYCANMACCGCYGNDVTYVLGESNDDQVGEERAPDFCTRLFQNLASFCCGMCCQCWCQCCGMCAIGQEEREISALIPKHRQLIDYMTFQPFLEYYPRIVELRKNATTSFWAHLRATSKLAQKLLIALGIFLIALTILALTRLDKQFHFTNLLILIATFLQAFFILHFVHWRWHRFDLSFDAIVKIFSSGFLLGTSLAMAYEWLVSFAFGIVTYILVVFDISAEMHGETPDDPNKWIITYLKSHIWLFAIGVFFNAYVVAALVEELCKYFSFWMLADHPDFMSEEDWKDVAYDESGTESGSKADEDNTLENAIQPLAEAASHKTVESKGMAITIAMVTAALGFACCENLMYVFSGSRGTSIGMEAGTLLVRSLFPIHPLAAAIQSIGVCRRDLEGNKSIGLGQIILPAVLLHGTFDFILMLIALIIGTRHADEYLDPNKDNTTIEETPADMKLEYISLGCGFVMVLLGTIYYVEQSRSQKKRLEDLEQDGTDIPLVL